MNKSTIHCDVLIVGAGIAGVAIAERLAREARRRDRRIRIIVADSAPMLASGSSSGLQGWFHTGSLYTRLNSSESYLNCVESHRILEREYAQAADFKHHKNCNHNSSLTSRNAWFGDPISFVLDKTDHPIWNNQVHAMTNRLYALGGSIDPDHQIDTSRYTTISTADRSMVTRNIIADLADSAMINGTEFLTGHRAVGLQDTDPDLPVTLEDDSGIQRTIHADYTFITTGHGIPDIPNITFSRRSGIIVSATPSLDAPNIVRIAQDPVDNISHIAHPPNASSETGYSAIGDSTSLADHPSDDECIRTAYRILQKVKSVFGSQVFEGRHVAWHMARKIEVATQDRDARTFGPMLCPISPNRHAVIPSKFSLFPSLAHLVLNQLIDDGLFDRLCAPAIVQSDTPKPLVAPMLSQRALGIANTKRVAYRYCGPLRSDNNPQEAPPLTSKPA